MVVAARHVQRAFISAFKLAAIVCASMPLLQPVHPQAPIAMHGGATCPEMAPFCIDRSAQYSFEFTSINGLETTAAAGSDRFGCLNSHPGEQWLYLTIQTSGSFAMDTSSDRDHDYAVWGPFTSVDAARATCGSLPSPTDCSYSRSATEHPGIPRVVSGEVYVVLLTNYARVTQALNAELGATNTAALSCAAVAVEQQKLENKQAGTNPRIYR